MGLMRAIGKTFKATANTAVGLMVIAPFAAVGLALEPIWMVYRWAVRTAGIEIKFDD